MWPTFELLVPIVFSLRLSYTVALEENTVVFEIPAKSKEIILSSFSIKNSFLLLGKYHCIYYHRVQPFLYTDAKWVTF